MMTKDNQISFRVDRSMYSAHQGGPRLVYGDLDRVVQPNLQYHYSAPVCAQRWLDVCEDPEYGHGKLLSRIDEIFPRLLRQARTIGELAPGIKLTSLGPGDGSVDLCILHHLDEQMTLESYCGFDFSFELLRRAIHRIGFGSGFRQSFPIQAVCGDFTDPGDCVRDNSGGIVSRLFSLTGFTMGNFEERGLLSRIEATMAPGDYLFLDARIHSLGPVSEDVSLIGVSKEKAFKSYEIPSVRRFVFGPAEVATQATVEDVDICLDVTQSVTSVPNAINTVIYCEGLDTQMRLTGKRVKRDRLDLAMTTMYRFEDLEKWLVQLGFRLVASERSSGMAFFLLQRKDNHVTKI